MGEHCLELKSARKQEAVFNTSVTGRMIEYSAWKLVFFFVCLFKIQVTRRTVSGDATEWLIVVNCILCAADH